MLTYMIAVVLIFLAIIIILLSFSIITWRLKWAVFVKDKDLPAEAIKGKHDDWWFFIKWIPRGLNAFINKKDDYKHRLPKILFGNNERIIKLWSEDGVYLYYIINTRVPDPGTYNICWPFSIAWTTKKFKYRRFGITLDYFGDDPNPVNRDNYWVLGAAWKTIKPFKKGE